MKGWADVLFKCPVATEWSGELGGRVTDRRAALLTFEERRCAARCERLKRSVEGIRCKGGFIFVRVMIREWNG